MTEIFQFFWLKIEIFWEPCDVICRECILEFPGTLKVLNQELHSSTKGSLEIMFTVPLTRFTEKEVSDYYYLSEI